jgi:RNA polymerase sigma-70 factor (sigma-E family)
MTQDAITSFAAFVEEAWRRHLRLATLLSGDRHRGEDLLQDSLVKLYLRWGRVRNSSDPHAYLRRVLANGSVSRWRRTRRETLTWETPERADHRAEITEPHEQLRLALMSLSRQQRAVVVLRYYADLSERQVAEELGCSLGSVKTQNHRAIAKLRKLLPSFDHSVQEVSR